MNERDALRRMGRSGAVGPDAVAAATVIVVRDPAGDRATDTAASPPEVLMLKRDSRLSFAGGLWVFPGGRVDPGDFDPADRDDLDRAERNAAAREANEEAGLTIEPTALVRLSHWTPPPEAHKRYSTAFFVVAAPCGSVVIDDGEIRDHRWIAPADALDAHRRGDIEIAPPTFITLTMLARHQSTRAMLDGAASSVVEHFSTRVAEVDGEVVALYHGDVGYDGGDPTVDGPRHRLWLHQDGWQYERR